MNLSSTRPALLRWRRSSGVELVLLAPKRDPNDESRQQLLVGLDGQRAGRDLVKQLESGGAPRSGKPSPVTQKRQESCFSTEPRLLCFTFCSICWRSCCSSVSRFYSSLCFSFFLAELFRLTRVLSCSLVFSGEHRDGAGEASSFMSLKFYSVVSGFSERVLLLVFDGKYNRRHIIYKTRYFVVPRANLMLIA